MLIPGYRALSSIRNLASNAQPGLIYLFQGERKILHLAAQELINRFALQEHVQVIAGGNRVSFEQLPHLLGERASEIYEVLDHISVSRAETCYQMLDALVALKPGPVPLVITDMLEPFYEEDLSVAEVGLLLKKCLISLKELSFSAPILISAEGDASRRGLLETLEQNSGMRFYLQPMQDAPQVLQVDLPGFC